MTKNLTLRTYVMPDALNPGGTIFGGWMMSEMDKAAKALAERVGGHRAVTRSVYFDFLKAGRVGTVLDFVAEVSERGNTSVEIAVTCQVNGVPEDILSYGHFVFVMVDAQGKPVRGAWAGAST